MKRSGLPVLQYLNHKMQHQVIFQNEMTHMETGSGLWIYPAGQSQYFLMHLKTRNPNFAFISHDAFDEAFVLNQFLSLGQKSK